MGGNRGGYFLGADRADIVTMVQESKRALFDVFGCDALYLDGAYVGAAKPSAEAVRRFTELVREKIEPFNIAGLMEPGVRNMYRHTVAVL